MGFSFYRRASPVSWHGRLSVVEADVSSSWAQLIATFGASTVTLTALVLVLIAVPHLPALVDHAQGSPG
jgi:hypothetical protein